MSIDLEHLYTRSPDALDRTAAGGVIARRDEHGTILIAFAREQAYDSPVLPKGGVDPGETIEQAARREIKEETGLTELTLHGELDCTSRMSYHGKYWVTTHYFLYTTRQVDGTPTDVDRHPNGPLWQSLDDLDALFWREQRALIEQHRETIRTAAAPA